MGGIYLCRDLINQPPNHMTPAALQTAMETLAKTHDATLETHIGAALETEFPAINIVGRAAEIGPRLMDLRWGKKARRLP